MEAIINGYVEGIALDAAGYVSEGSGENLFVVIDGGTAAGSLPPGAYYPTVGKAWTSVAGRETNLDDIFLPLIAPGTLAPVSQSQDTTITFPDSVSSIYPSRT